MGNDVAGFYL